MPQLGVPELLIILVIALIFFGPSRLPEASAALGRSIRDFQRAVRGQDSPPDAEDASEETNQQEDSKTDGD